jgi:hypothetical protein
VKNGNFVSALAALTLSQVKKSLPCVFVSCAFSTLIIKVCGKLKFSSCHFFFQVILHSFVTALQICWTFVDFSSFALFLCSFLCFLLLFISQPSHFFHFRFMLGKQQEK